MNWQTLHLAINIFFCILSLCECGRDFYRILGVSHNANAGQIKKAYRKLAKELHPDKHPDDEVAHEQFHDLSAAYEVLSNDEKRQIYDEEGEEGLNEMDEHGTGHHGDPYDSFFGDFFDRDNGEEYEEVTPKGADVVVDLWVTLEELFNGNFMQVLRQKPVFEPASGTRPCNCRNEMQTMQMGPGRFQMFQDEVCDECPNVRLTTEERMLEVEVEAGMRDGQQAQSFVGEGEPHVDGDSGDLHFVVRQTPHAHFHRVGAHLFTNMTISLLDALVGFRATLTQLDGVPLDVTRDGVVTWPGAVVRKRGRGMPHWEDVGDTSGDLFVTFDVQFPRGAFTDEHRGLLETALQREQRLQPKAPMECQADNAGDGRANERRPFRCLSVFFEFFGLEIWYVWC